MRKMNLKKIAAFVLAGTMAIGMSATAMASGLNTSTSNEGVTSSSFKKEYKTDKDTYAPKTTFRFWVRPGAAIEDPLVYKGVKGLVKTTTVDSTAVAGEQNLTPSFTYDVSVVTKPGVYHYEVKEDDTGIVNMTYDTTVRDLYVYVVNGTNGLVVSGAEMYKRTENTTVVNPGSQNGKTDTFTNKYGLDDDNKNTLKDLTVTKKIEGDMADKTAKWEFTINIASGERTTYKVYTLAAGSTTPIAAEKDLTAGEDYTVSLGNGDKVIIKNLAETDDYTVSETKANSDGYTTTATNNAGNYTLGTKTDMGTDAETVTVTNTKNAATPTGIIMNYAPYIAMLAAACVLAVVFFNRRREDA